MKIASWNVNSLRVRLPHVLDWLNKHQPDILGLQELKMPTEAFPTDEIAELGYKSVAFGQKTYNGVALLSRHEPANVTTGLPDFPDEQSRVIAADYGSVRVANLYVPNGQTIGAEKFVYKLAWLNALRAWLAAELVANANIVVMGDFNIAPADRDVYDPQQWRDKILCSDDERAQLQGIEAIGFADTFRLFDQPDNIFSWWDYRAAAFRRKRGLRIDLILASAAMAERCTTSDVDSEPRKLERPSDHAPVFAVFEPTP